MMIGGRVGIGGCIAGPEQLAAEGERVATGAMAPAQPCGTTSPCSRSYVDEEG